jgi:hypothetical protein
LGGSLAVIKQIVNLPEANDIWKLYVSWSGFVVTIVLTIVSFIVGSVLIRQLRAAAEKYYLHGDETAYKVSERNSLLISIVNWSSGMVFVVSILLLASFVGGNVMSEGDKGTRPASTIEEAKRSQPVTEFQKVPASGWEVEAGAAQSESAEGDSMQQPATGEPEKHDT